MASFASSPTFSGLMHLTEGSITVLPRRIYMTRIQKSDLNQALRQLLELMLFGDADSICSYTETPQSEACEDPDDTVVSLFIDEVSLKKFDPEVVLQGESYRAIHVFEGPEALSQCGYIFHLSNVLVQNGIEVVYLSTFNTDLLLVSEEDVERAHTYVVSSLCTLEATSAQFARDAEEQFLLTLDESVSQRSTTPSFSAMAGADLHFSRGPDRLHLVSLSREGLEKHAFHLFKLLLAEPQPTRFFSFTSVQGEITIVVNEKDFQLLHTKEGELLSGLVAHETSWSLLQLNAGATGGVTQNTVSLVSKILALHMIDIYYLSTVSFDFIFTPTVKAEKAVAALLAADPTITLTSH